MGAGGGGGGRGYSGAVKTQGFVWKFLCTIYKFLFIYSFTDWNPLCVCLSVHVSFFFQPISSKLLNLFKPNLFLLLILYVFSLYVFGSVVMLLLKGS